MALKFLSVLAAFASAVSAHGYVDHATVGGVFYEGYQPFTSAYYDPIPNRIIRPVQRNGPIIDLTLIDLQCGGYTAGGVVGSEPANLTVGLAAAESVVSLYWTLRPTSHSGPVLTYMAKCPNNNCENWLPGTSAVWFKIAHAGEIRSTGVWASTPMMSLGYAYTYTIPKCLAAGAYIVRHEIIALQTAGTYPGVQFYPSCHQISITSTGTSTGGTLHAIPGIYAATDPGITYNMYEVQNYTIPGPPVFTC